MNARAILAMLLPIVKIFQGILRVHVNLVTLAMEHTVMVRKSTLYDVS